MGSSDGGPLLYQLSYGACRRRRGSNPRHMITVELRPARANARRCGHMYAEGTWQVTLVIRPAPNLVTDMKDPAGSYHFQ